MAEFDFAVTQSIIQNSLGIVLDNKFYPPDRLYHYCSLPVCASILAGSIWLSHAEYSNDEEEVALGRSMIANRLNGFPPLIRNPLFQQSLITQFMSLSSSLEVFIWCFSDIRGNNFAETHYTDQEGSIQSVVIGSAGPQDKMSQWRAYGSDGKGACLTVTKASLNSICKMPLRINPVIYDQILAYRTIDAFIAAGIASGNARSTAAALLYLLPLIKHPGFVEEMEWRLIYVQSKYAMPKPNFHMSRELYAPHHDLKNVLTADPDLSINEDVRDAVRNNNWLVDITDVMIGPSRHKTLNARSMLMRIDAVGRAGVTVTESAIPYRS